MLFDIADHPGELAVSMISKTRFWRRLRGWQLLRVLFEDSFAILSLHI